MLNGALCFVGQFNVDKKTRLMFILIGVPEITSRPTDSCIYYSNFPILISCALLIKDHCIQTIGKHGCAWPVIAMSKTECSNFIDYVEA